MNQSRAHSALEAVANVAIGWVFAVVTQLLVFPVVGLQASLTQHLGISGVFTAISLLRSYLLRRVFNAWARTER